MRMKIYHIVSPEIWEHIKEGGEYVPESMATEGFVHCSFAYQVDDVLERYYASRSSVVVLEIETELLTARLVEEASTNDDVYPHVYGTIDPDAITSAESIELGNDVNG